MIQLDRYKIATGILSAALSERIGETILYKMNRFKPTRGIIMDVFEDEFMVHSHTGKKYNVPFQSIVYVGEVSEKVMN